MTTGSRVADHLQPLPIEVTIGMDNLSVHDPGKERRIIIMRNWSTIDGKRAWPQAALARSSPVTLGRNGETFAHLRHPRLVVAVCEHQFFGLRWLQPFQEPCRFGGL